jgi:molybdenum cofactor cytidylyltransferase
MPKLSLELAPGRRLGMIALAEMLACECIESITAVVRKSDKLQWIPELERHALLKRNTRLRVVPCEDAVLGMSYTLREGLKAALSESPQAIMIVLADQPFITADILNNLASVYRDRPELDYVACSSGPTAAAMPPALFASSMYDALSRLEGDMGARKLLASPAYRGVLVKVPSENVFMDIDTPFELKNARKLWMSNN